MIAAALAAAPVFALIFLGYAVRRAGVIPRQAWGALDRLAFFVFFPGLIIRALVRADITAASGGVALTALSSFAAVTIMVLALKPVLRLPGPAYSSVFQAATRWNFFIFFAIATALYGPEIEAYGAIILGALLAPINIAAITALAVWGSGASRTRARVALDILRNPLVIACGLGFALNFAGAPLDNAFGATLDLLAQPALPVGLMVVGAGLDFSAVRGRWAAIGVGAGLKLLAMPLLMTSFAALYGLDGAARAAVILAGAAPCAIASYIYARQMGGDAPLMAGIITVSTAASIVTIPLVVAWLI